MAIMGGAIRQAIMEYIIFCLRDNLNSFLNNEFNSIPTLRKTG